MKTMTKGQIRDLVHYFKKSACVRANEITELAKELAEDGDRLEDIEVLILEEINACLEDFYYSYFEDCGSYKRHVWNREYDY